MSNNQTNQKTIVDDFIGVIAFAMLFGFLYCFWVTSHAAISKFFIIVRGIESFFFLMMHKLFLLLGVESLASLFSPFTKAVRHFCQPSNQLSFWDCTYPAQFITWDDLSASSLAWNIFFAMFAVYALGKGILEVNKKHPKNRFGKKLDLEDAIKEFAPIYPHLMVFGPINMQEWDNSKGAFRGMLTSREFLYEHQLTRSFIPRSSSSEALSEADMLDVIPEVDIEKFNLLLVDQVGLPWANTSLLTVAELIILAIVLPRACATDENTSAEDHYMLMDKTTDIIEKMWFWVKNNQFDPESKNGLNDYDLQNDPAKLLETVNSFLQIQVEGQAQYAMHPVAERVFKAHAYTRTALVEFFYLARQLGKLPPAEFRWLQLYDRTLWAAIQNIGRPSMYSEGIGVISHYTMEKLMKQPIYQPNFDVALNGFSQQISEFSYSKNTQDALLSHLNNNRIGFSESFDDEKLIGKIIKKNVVG